MLYARLEIVGPTLENSDAPLPIIRIRIRVSVSVCLCMKPREKGKQECRSRSPECRDHGRVHVCLPEDKRI